jgi:hypothetical protein
LQQQLWLHLSCCRCCVCSAFCDLSHNQSTLPALQLCRLSLALTAAGTPWPALGPTPPTAARPPSTQSLTEHQLTWPQ